MTNDLRIGAPEAVAYRPNRGLTWLTGGILVPFGFVYARQVWMLTRGGKCSSLFQNAHQHPPGSMRSDFPTQRGRFPGRSP